MQIVGAQHAAEASPVDEQSWPGQPVSVSVSGLKVQAPGGDSSLAPLSLRIQAGEHVALVRSQRQQQIRAAGADCFAFCRYSKAVSKSTGKTLEAGSATQLRRRMAW